MVTWIIVVLPLIGFLLQVPRLLEGIAAAENAASEAARYAIARGDGDLDEAAREQAERVIDGYSRSNKVTSTVETEGAEAAAGEPFTVRVTVDLPIIELPGFPVVNRSYTATYHERIPDYGGVATPAVRTVPVDTDEDPP